MIRRALDAIRSAFASLFRRRPVQSATDVWQVYSCGCMLINRGGPPPDRCPSHGEAQWAEWHATPERAGFEASGRARETESTYTGK